MAVSIDIRADIKAVERQLSKAQRQVVPRAAAHALNTTARQVQSAAVKQIARETGIKQKDVRVALSRLKASWRTLTASVVASGRALNLIRFVTPAKQKSGAFRKQAGVIANAWGKKRVYPGTFIGNKGRTVFRRAKGAGPSGRVKRLPILPVWGPSIPRTMATKEVEQQLETTARTRWPVNFRQDLKFYLSRTK